MQFGKLQIRKVILFFVLFAWIKIANSQPLLAEGQLERVLSFPSAYLDSQQFDVWLPPYFNPNDQHSLLFMLDGQMLFDSTETWNHQCWDVDETAGRLINEDSISPVIIVAIYSQWQTRRANYFPQLPYESLSPIEKDSVQAQFKRTNLAPNGFKPNSDNFLKFISQELYPYITSRYPVFKDPAHTFIAGSSMGGLISMYALCQYPEIFGGAACISTHWPGGHTMEFNPLPKAFFSYLQNHLPNPANHKIYFDCGDQTLDAYYPPFQRQVDEIVKQKGYTAANWLTKYCPGQAHDEKAWKSRLNGVLRFLMAKTN